MLLFTSFISFTLMPKHKNVRRAIATLCLEKHKPPRRGICDSWQNKKKIKKTKDAMKNRTNNAYIQCFYYIKGPRAE